MVVTWWIVAFRTMAWSDIYDHKTNISYYNSINLSHVYDQFTCGCCEIDHTDLACEIDHTDLAILPMISRTETISRPFVTMQNKRHCDVALYYVHLQMP